MMPRMGGGTKPSLDALGKPCNSIDSPSATQFDWGWTMHACQSDGLTRTALPRTALTRSSDEAATPRRTLPCGCSARRMRAPGRVVGGSRRVCVPFVLHGHHASRQGGSTGARARWSKHDRLCAMAALVLAQFCGFAVGVAVTELKSAQPVTGTLGGAVTNRQHLYFINVSALIGRDTDMSTTAAPQRLSVKLTQDKGQGTMGGIQHRVQPMVLSLCRDQLPCAGVGCTCPSKFVDDGTHGGMYSEVLSRQPDAVRSVDVSPCDLEVGMWYVSVDLPLHKVGEFSAAARITTGYTMTAVLETALMSFGEASADVVCCMQSQYFVVDISKLVKGNELRVKLLSDDRTHNQSPLRLSMSYDGCVDRRMHMVSDATQGRVVTIPPEQLRAGRLFVGVHAIDRDTASFLLSISYRPELKWTVIAFLVTMFVVVIVTLSVVCCVRVRRRMRKIKTFSDEVKLRKKTLKMTVRGAASDDGSVAPSASGRAGRVNLSDSDDSGEEEPLQGTRKIFIDLL